jgi:hypothetical protein
MRVCRHATAAHREAAGSVRPIPHQPGHIPRSRGVRELARMLGQFLPEQRSFEYTYKALEGKMAFLAKAGELRRPFITG